MNHQQLLSYFMFILSIYIISIGISIALMKKYQLWLQRKQYTQHLLNLLKIRSSINTPNEGKHRKIYTSLDTLKNHWSQDSTAIRQTSRLGDISYPILNRELNNKKIRLLRKVQLSTQNQNMAKRIKQVKPVLSFKKHKHAVSTSSLLEYRVKEKKEQQTNDQLRQSKFRRYIKWQSKHIGVPHRYYLHVQISNITKFMSVRSQYAALWCQLETEGKYVQSEMNRVEPCASYKYHFALDSDLGEEIVLRLFLCKGIQSEIFGEFVVSKPNIGENEAKWVKSKDGRFEIELKLKYNKLKKAKPCITIK